ncbi:LacI family DNA-binding transcriptional regulator [Agromyces aerolatus]|uniref:LacI family DNA-binding transcriptional regulator n=1 Tax=Agromyces sp. LY-1074 TaxID=3074080 RepID=UPI002859E5B7|nr:MULTISPECIES: LacI family DNA-binding transcriptional regulator [unclassified Agromyces]MDR5700437.1 LacI family DNA-binding transcriptional regulator [Agromyces sp. LY-1074]MDR5706958.1 LacI family DNA-binding transcriptional regulator [Agromyces sp. LY-1358]
MPHDTRTRGRKATREDVAALAGTSVAVVSYVTNGGPRPVAAETRARVERAIDELGYRPNSVAKSLASGSSGALALLVPDISNSFFATMAHALEDAVTARGKVLLLGDAAESMARESELIDAFLDRQVDGLIYIGVHDRSHASKAMAAGVPLVVLDRKTSDSHASSALVDNVGGAFEATRHLIGHGYRRIGIVEGPAGISTAQDRVLGWERAMQEAGLTVQDGWRARGPFTKADGFRAGLEILGSDDAPEALFVSSEQQAIGVLLAAHKLKIHVPSDLALFSFDGTAESQFSVPPLSTVVQPFGDLANTAVDLLLDRATAPGVHVVCDFSLAIRESCGCDVEAPAGTEA